jgi:NAD(P)-dependent dehydrogenase (short-subunit alcohol dehydrogenase family)
MDLGLKGKVAAITGATKGIGLAVARGLAAEGAHICLCSRTEGEAVEAAKALEKEFGVKAHGVKADTTLSKDIDGFIHSVEEAFGGADILISNAGGGSMETIVESNDEGWQYFWDLHVMAAVRLSRGFVPLMRKRGGGVIITNASICGRRPLSHEPIYNTVKAAVVMLAKCLANEVTKDNIRVNCVNPGLIMTDAWRRGAKIHSKKEGISPEEYLDRIAKEYTPIGRFATPEELANVFVFLCSDRASYCVGSSFYVDGGWLETTV